MGMLVVSAGGMHSRSMFDGQKLYEPLRRRWQRQRWANALAVRRG